MKELQSRYLLVDISGQGKNLVIVSGTMTECRPAYKAIPGISRNSQNNKQVSRQGVLVGVGHLLTLDSKLDFVKRFIGCVSEPGIVAGIPVTSPNESLSAPNYWIQASTVIVERGKIFTFIYIYNNKTR